MFLSVLLACTPADDSGADRRPHDSGAEAAARRVPAEWEPQAAVWLQWPQRWESSYEDAFAHIVATAVQYEPVHVLYNDADTRASAVTTLVDVGGVSSAVIGGAPSDGGFMLHWDEIPNDSAWMRDNGPRYVWVDGELRIQDWGFDAWGGAFGDIPYAADDAVPTVVGEQLGLPVDDVAIVHERGDLEFNGVDTVILNWSVIGDPHRNPGITQERAIAAMKEQFGVTRVVLLEGTPAGDLTGGHVDGIARFLPDGRVVVGDCTAESACQPGDADDTIYDDSARRLADAGIEVVRWPFAGKVRFKNVWFDTDYMNWLVGNDFVITVGFANPETDDAAKAQLEAWFPGRDVYVFDTRESWYAGGGVHCHTNDQPAE